MPTAPTSTGTRPAPRARLRAAGPALLALVLTSTAWLAGLHGVDLAAQTYHADLFRVDGLVIWDSGWYGGDLPLSYSVLSPPLGVLLGIGPLLIIGAVVSSWAFDRIVTTMLGRRSLGSWYFAACTVLSVTIGQTPYLSGEALALCAVVALLRGRRSLGVVLGIASALCSPLAAAFLVMICMVWAATDPVRRRRMVLAAVATTVAIGSVSLAFPGEGPFPFAWTGLVVVELLCLTVLSPLVRTTRAVRLCAAVYGLACLASFVVPNPLGGNAVRLAESFGIPLVACMVVVPSAGAVVVPSWLRRRRIAVHLRRPAGALARRPGLGLAALLPFVVWQWAPGTGVVASASPTPSDSAAFYQPLVATILADSHGTPTRVEVVPTRDHWEAAYVAPELSLARGWERQIDLRDNTIFYATTPLTAAVYHRWLLDDGVSWVALPTAPLDYSGKAEAALLSRGHVAGLDLVWSSTNWKLWHVEGDPGILSGPATLTELAPDHLDLVVHHAGTILVRVHWTTYWHLEAPETQARACVAPLTTSPPYDWTVVRARRTGPLDLVATLLGGVSADCPSP